MSDEAKLKELMKNFTFAMHPDGTEGCYSFNNFTHNGQFGWVCRISSPDGTMIVSANVEYCLARALEREYAVTLSNLNYALDKVGIPKYEITAPKELTWCEAASKFFNEAMLKLPNANVEMMAFGEDFIMTRINSIKQAKKVMKTKAVRESPYVIDRRKRQIVIIDKAIIEGAKA